MGIYTTRPIKELTKKDFKNRIIKPILLSPHALDHLSKGQRNIFKEQELIDIVAKEVPRKVYLQENGRYAMYYRKKEGYRKIIIDIEDNKTTIVSFMDTLELPKIKL